MTKSGVLGMKATGGKVAFWLGKRKEQNAGQRIQKTEGQGLVGGEAVLLEWSLFAGRFLDFAPLRSE